MALTQAVTQATSAPKRSQEPPAAARYPLSEKELATFHEQGVVGPFTLHDRDWMKATWRRLRLKLMDREKSIYPVDELSGNTNLANYDRHIDDDFLAETCCRPEIVDRVSSILGPNVLCWRSEFFSKYPNEEGTDWHQADTFAMASGKPQIIWPGEVKDAVTKSPFGGTITVWIAFTDAVVETGALQFIPGTHRTMFYDETGGMKYDPNRINTMEKGGIRRGFWGYDFRQLQIDPNWEPDEAKAIGVPCLAGQFVIFWSTTMHASYPHAGLTNDYRLAFALRYVPSSVRVYPDTEYLEEYGGKVALDKYGAVVVAGKNDESTHNRIITHSTRGKPYVAR
jgi:non-haem Fe2+, alpha-ketoglutarate-dependent halogenase